jgi:hypothetical protein
MMLVNIDNNKIIDLCWQIFLYNMIIQSSH